MSSDERRSLWHTTLDGVSLPEEKLVGESNNYLTILMDWNLLHQVYNHKKATIARYRMLTMVKSIFVNLIYTSVDLLSPLGPTLGFSSIEDSISAAVTIANRISNTNQQYSIPLPANLIYLYKRGDSITNETKTLLTRSVRTIGLDIPVIGKLPYVQGKREQDPRGIFYLNVKDGIPFAHVQEERLASKSRFRPKEQIVYDGMHYVLLSNKTENSTANLLAAGALAVHDYTDDIEISPWESEENLRQYLTVVQSGTYVTMALNDLYSCDTSSGIVYYSKFLPTIHDAYTHISISDQKCILVESFTLPYLVLEGEPTFHSIGHDLIYFMFGESKKKVDVKADVLPSASIESNDQAMTGHEMGFHTQMELPIQLDLQSFFSSGLAEVLAKIEKLESKINLLTSTVDKLPNTIHSSSSSSSSPNLSPNQCSYSSYAQYAQCPFGTCFNPPSSSTSSSSSECSSGTCLNPPTSSSNECPSGSCPSFHPIGNQASGQCSYTGCPLTTGAQFNQISVEDIQSSTSHSSPSVEDIQASCIREPIVGVPMFTQLPTQQGFHFFSASAPIGGQMKLEDIMKILIPPHSHVYDNIRVTETDIEVIDDLTNTNVEPINVPTKMEEVLTETDIEAVNVFDRILEVNSQPPIVPKQSVNTNSHPGCIRLPASVTGAFAPIHLDVPSDSESDEEEDITTSNVSTRVDSNSISSNVGTGLDSNSISSSTIVEGLLNPPVSVAEDQSSISSTTDEPEIVAIIDEVPIAELSNSNLQKLD